MNRFAKRIVSALLLFCMVCSLFGTVRAVDTGAATLVTDVSTLEAGDRIIIAAAGYDYALSTNQKTSNRGQSAITKSGSTVIYGNDTQIITLENGNVSGTFAFNVGALGYLCAVSSSANNLKCTATLSDSASWAIQIDANTGVAAIVAKGDYTRNVLRYNSSSSLFACYAANNNQKDICIYEVTGGSSDDSGNSGGSTDGCNHDWSNGVCTKCGADYEDITFSPTGYTRAEDVVYNIVNGYVANWGARGETCGFLTTYATDYYTGSYTYDTLSALDGGTSASSAPDSELYAALQDMMVTHHTTLTKYSASGSPVDCRNFYLYTDCMKGDTNYVSTLYRGLYVNSAWDGGVTYNQEHVWPKSKCLCTEEIGDLMHLRPANPRENSSRNNTAYGESAEYYDPGASVRGDCARTILYIYTRWGNTVNMWGVDGVMESLDILLKWIEEDPVDTWEMGHNDAVQSITGVRNVFVDYPEYAFQLFGEEVPADMATPSGGTEPEVEDSKDIKWQVTSGTNASSASTNLRLLTWVDTLEDYSSVTFNVTINGKTTKLECTTVYTAILASGVAIRNPANIFKNARANYFVTYTLKNIPKSSFDIPIVVTVTWTDRQGNQTISESKTIVISSDWA